MANAVIQYLKEALLKKQSTCSISHGFKQKVMGSGSFQFHQPLWMWETPLPNPQKSSPHCVKGFADDLTIISQHGYDHASVLRMVSKKCSDIDLEIHSDKCVVVVYNGSKVKKTCSFPIGEGHTRNLSSDVMLPVLWATR